MKNQRSYTLFEISLVLSLKTIIFFIIFKLFLECPFSQEKDDLLQGFIQIESLLLKTQSIQWNGKELILNIYNKKNEKISYKKVKCPRDKILPKPCKTNTFAIKITPKKEIASKNTLKLVWPSVGSHKWFIWDNELQIWNNVKNNKIYKKSFLKLILFGRDGDVTETFVWQKIIDRYD